MGAAWVHKCDKCNYSVHTSGPWEFYRDNEGKRKFYGHPVVASEEAEQRGIYGLSCDLYCLNCDETFDLIQVEFKKPSFDSLSVWVGKCEPKDKYKVEDAVRCPKCDGIDLMLLPVKDREITCPRCKEGKLVGEMEWIS